jgi:hypothetical protein
MKVDASNRHPLEGEEEVPEQNEFFEFVEFY